ncbi:MAG: lipid-A-disaccharide synthase [Luteitalea sp.]|nr:lipid-A-disaccharide synthase [Luteitalea sp.]
MDHPAVDHGGRRGDRPRAPRQDRGRQGRARAVARHQEHHGENTRRQHRTRWTDDHRRNRDLSRLSRPRPGRDQGCGGGDRAGVRRHERLGEGSQRDSRCAGSHDPGPAVGAAARHHRRAAGGGRRAGPGSSAPRCQGRHRQGAPRHRAVGQRSRPDGDVLGSGHQPGGQTDLCGWRRRSAAGRGALQRLQGGRGAAGRVHGEAAGRRPAGARTPRHRVRGEHADQLDALHPPDLLTVRRLLLSCGEPSGDLYAGALTCELRSLAPGIEVSGLGGPQFAAAGGRLIADFRGLAVTGLTEAIAKVPQSLRTLRRMVDAARDHRPDALVVIDFPDFNFPLARRIKRLGIPIVYYIAPQIWAWRSGRIKTIRRIADRVVVIFPFEEAIYRDSGVPVEFVGHPLVDLARPSSPRAPFLTRLGLAPEAPTVAVLPGSRPNEVRRILPDLVAAARLVRGRLPRAQFVFARAPNLDDRLFEGARRLSDSASPPAFSIIVEGESDAVLASADLALVASGTATVQTALHDTPMVVVYRLSPLTYRLGRPLVKVDTFAMVNLIAGERVVPELIQDAFTPEAVAAEGLSMLTDAGRAARIREGLKRVRARLGGPGASRRAAEVILQVAGESCAASS